MYFFIIFMLIQEHAIHHVEEVAKHSGYDGVFNKVSKEMMILGLVSFTTFVVFEGLNVSSDSVWYHAFHFSHFVMLFIALAFVFQALMLTKFISIQRQRLYRLFYVAESKIVSKYEFMMNYANNTVRPRFMWFMYTLFFEAPYSFPYPALRDAMEYKIIEEHFVRTFLLPEQFHFAEYMSTRFQSHVFALVDVQPSSWFVLILMILANYGRIKLIDPLFQEDVCDEYDEYDEHDYDSHGRRMFIHRVLAASKSPACDQYTLRVAFVYSMFLSLLIFLVYQVSNFYYRRHLQYAVSAVAEPVQYRCEQHVPFRPEFDDDADYKKTGHRFRSFYKVCLMNVAAIKKHERSIYTVRILKKMRDLEHEVERQQAEAAREAAEEARRLAAPEPPKPVRDQGKFANDVFVRGEGLAGQTRDIHSHAAGSTDHSAPQMSATTTGGDVRATEPVPLMTTLSSAERAADAEEGVDTFNCSPVPLSDRSNAGLLRIDSETIDSPRASNGGIQHENSWAPPPTDGRNLGRDYSWREPAPLERSLSRDISWVPPSDPRVRQRARSVSKLDSTFAHVHRIPPTPTAETDSRSGGRSGVLGRVPSFSHGGGHTDPDDSIHVSRAGNITLGSRARSMTTHLHGDFHELERFDNTMSRGQSLQDFYASVSMHLSKNKHGHGHEHRRSLSVGARRHKTELVTVDGTGETGSSSQDQTVVNELKLENDTSHIFLWRSQWVYRFSVELSLLLQCFYMALWATNLIVVATGAEHFPVQWAVGLTFPMFLNFWMLRSILFLSCTLEAVSALNVKDSGLVCERIMQKEDALDKFRTEVRRKLMEMPGLVALDRRKFIREQLKELDYVNENDEEDTSQDTTEYRITYEQFAVFLEELEIDMTDSEFDLLCHVLDDQKTNISGDRGALNIISELVFEDSISILHIYSILFPEVVFLLDSHNQHVPSAQMAEESLDLYDTSTLNERQLFRRDEKMRQRAKVKAKDAAKASAAPAKVDIAPWYSFEGLRHRVHNFFQPPKSFADDIEVVNEEQASNSEYIRKESDGGEKVFTDLETVVDPESGAIVIKRMHSKANIMGDEMFARKKSERRGRSGKERRSITDEIEMVVDGSVFGFAADGDDTVPEHGGDVEAGTAGKSHGNRRSNLTKQCSESVGDFEYALSIDSHAKNVGISALKRSNSLTGSGKS